MIPKILHFIWIGNKNAFPEYGKRSIDAFKKMNPDFEVNIFQKTTDEMIQLIRSDNVFKNIAIDTCNKTIDYMNNVKKQLSNNGEFPFWEYFLSMKCKLSDAIRFHLLEKHGGIYLDIDCYPIRPFDDYVLNRNCFITTSQNPPFGWDLYCIGRDHTIKNAEYYNNMLDIQAFKITNNISWHDFFQLKYRFNIGCLDTTDIKVDVENKYIYHFSVGTKME